MLKKSKLFTIYILLFIFGILIANFFNFNFDIFYLFITLLSLVVLLIIFWKNKKVSLMILGLAFLLLGFWRFGISLPKINEYHIGYYNESQIEFIGQVMDEPDEQTVEFEFFGIVDDLLLGGIRAGEHMVL